MLFSLTRPPPSPTLFPYTTLFRSRLGSAAACATRRRRRGSASSTSTSRTTAITGARAMPQNGWVRPTVTPPPRSEEHTSELQSHSDLVCRLLLEKKKGIEHHIAPV